MYDFKYIKVDNVDRAAELLTEDDEGILLGGGMTLIPTMKQRLAQPTQLLDLGGVKELVGIEHNDDRVVVQAMTTHAAVASSGKVTRNIPALADLAGEIGDPQVRNRGTIGGSMANADPSADYPAAVVGLNATIKTNRRSISGDEFFIDMFETALEGNEIITSVSFPIPKRSAYAKFANPASRYAVVGVFIAEFDGEFRVAVTGAKGSVYRLNDAEAALNENATAEALDVLESDATDMNDDIHASAEYRAHLVNVMLKRAFAALSA